MTDTFIGRVKRYVELRERQKELEHRAGTIKDEANELEQQILEDFTKEGVDRMTVDGHTVYLHEQMWAGLAEDVDSSEVVEALKAAGLGHLVAERYNSSTLSAYMRDLRREGVELPEALRPKLRETFKHSARIRRAG